MGRCGRGRRHVHSTGEGLLHGSRRADGLACVEQDCGSRSAVDVIADVWLIERSLSVSMVLVLLGDRARVDGERSRLFCQRRAGVGDFERAKECDVAAH